MSKSLQYRLIVSGIGIPLLIFLLSIPQALYTVLLFSLFGMLGIYEGVRLLARVEMKTPLVLLLLGTLALTSLPLWQGMRAGLDVFFFVFIAWVFLIMLNQLFTLTPGRQGLSSMAASLFLFTYFGLFWALMMQLRTYGPFGGFYLLLTFFTVWGGDSGAYFTGKYLGRHKLFPSVSPKKTWEGVAGNYLGAYLGVLLFRLCIFSGVPWAHLLILAPCLGTISLFSDLMESFIKRCAGVKDSGILFPGHGGVLDRADSITFSAAAVLFYVHYLQ